MTAAKKLRKSNAASLNPVLNPIMRGWVVHGERADEGLELYRRGQLAAGADAAIDDCSPDDTFRFCRLPRALWICPRALDLRSIHPVNLRAHRLSQKVGGVGVFVSLQM